MQQFAENIPDMIDRSAILRLLSSLIAEELSVVGKPMPDHFTLTETTFIGVPIRSAPQDAPHIPIDSIDLLAVATRVSSFFHIFESGIDDALLMHRTVGDWIDIVLQSRADADCTGNLTFRTSGSSGQPKHITHARQNLLAEARSLQLLLAGLNVPTPHARIVGVVPPHHLYGFMWTVALPNLSRLHVLAAPPASMALARTLKPGDILIAHPTWYATIGSLIPNLHGITAISSAGVLPESIAAGLLSKGAAAVLDIYGSTETGGIAARCFPNPCHALLPHWQRGGDGEFLLRSESALDGDHVPLCDSVNWHDPHTFTIGARLDGAIKIAGTNVFPSHVAELLTSHPEVRLCSVRVDTPKHPAETPRLKAFIVPEDTGVLVAQATLDELRSQLEQFARKHLISPQRPARFDFGHALPTGTLGKSADW